MQTSQNISQNPLISFIITDYNIPGKMLEECLQSIFSLSLSPSEIEVILVDDGSDISPLTTMEALIAHRNEVVYIRQKNQGLSVARNIGLKMANGKYIQFVDGDDYLLRAPYEHCLDIVRYHNPDIVLFDETSKPQPEIPFAFEGPLTGTAYLHNHNMKAATWGYIFKKDILGKLRFTPNLLHEDEEFTPQLILRAEKLYKAEAKAYFYRMRKDSLTNTPDPTMKEKRLNDTMQIIAHLQELSERLPSSERIALERRVHQLSMDLLYNTIKETHSATQLEHTIANLRGRDLFPLPDKKYSKKYNTFRKMVNSRLGRRILLIGIR
ncbi:glycosyl transferase family 2 [Prevotella sp. oral taxon 376]|uniref:glycosyltransferase n=1 Tax=Prevotella sp. oral taxon 376 TaxID=712466 RepID=UPI000D1E8368|nr:glycosyltransferase [Prevotella sp. oral taxon 376]PTL32587.1 glycosyl transferase family 2 [Prevotella sp. oral taxon 376]